MRKLVLSLIAVIFCVGAVTAQKNEHVKVKMPYNETRNVGNFNALNVSSVFNVYISDGNSSSVQIRSSHDVLKYITTEVVSGTLVIKLTKAPEKWESQGQKRRIDISISKSNLSAIRASGAVDIHGLGVIKTGNLVVIASGASDVKINAEVSGELTCTASGSSDIELKGSGNNASVKASGSSDVEMKRFILNSAKVMVSGASDVTVNATEYLDLSASGSSDIKYYGEPKRVDVRKSGAADIERGRKK